MEIKSWVGVFIHKPYQGGFLPLKTNAGRLFSGTKNPPVKRAMNMSRELICGRKVEFYKSKLYSPWAQIMKAVGPPTGEQLTSRQGLVVEITVCDCGLLAGLDGGARQQCSSPKAGSPRPDGHQPQMQNKPKSPPG